MGRTLGFVRGHGLRLQELVPGRARALLVGTGVPRRRADDEAVEGSNTGAIEVINHHSLKARLGSQVAATIGCDHRSVCIWRDIHCGAVIMAGQTVCTVEAAKGVPRHRLSVASAGAEDQADLHLNIGRCA